MCIPRDFHTVGCNVSEPTCVYTWGKTSAFSTDSGGSREPPAADPVPGRAWATEGKPKCLGALRPHSGNALF